MGRYGWKGAESLFPGVVPCRLDTPAKALRKKWQVVNDVVAQIMDRCTCLYLSVCIVLLYKELGRRVGRARLVGCDSFANSFEGNYTARYNAKLSRVASFKVQLIGHIPCPGW